MCTIKCYLNIVIVIVIIFGFPSEKYSVVKSLSVIMRSIICMLIALNGAILR